MPKNTEFINIWLKTDIDIDAKMFTRIVLNSLSPKIMHNIEGYYPHYQSLHMHYHNNLYGVTQLHYYTFKQMILR